MITIRDYDPSDENWIYSSWLKSMRDSTPYNFMKSDHFFVSYHKILEEILKTAKIKILCSEDDPSVIISYCVYEIIDDKLVVHFALTRDVFSRLGFMRKLLFHVEPRLEENGFTVSCYPRFFDHLARKRLLFDFLNKNKITFNPFKGAP